MRWRRLLMMNRPPKARARSAIAPSATGSAGTVTWPAGVVPGLIVIDRELESALAPPASETRKTRPDHVPSAVGVPLISPL